MVTMPEKVSTLEVRQRIGDLLNRVSLRQDEFIIERKGKPLAALVPVERLQQMQRFARQQALDLMEAQTGGALSGREADAIALEAQRAVRRTPRRARPAARSK
jgi:prevent-host-death family protein